MAERGLDSRQNHQGIHPFGHRPCCRPIEAGSPQVSLPFPISRVQFLASHTYTTALPLLPASSVASSPSIHFCSSSQTLILLCRSEVFNQFPADTNWVFDNSILTLSTWCGHQIPQGRGSDLPDCPHFRCPLPVLGHLCY